jgi:hypothetical protein
MKPAFLTPGNTSTAYALGVSALASGTFEFNWLRAFCDSFVLGGRGNGDEQHSSDEPDRERSRRLHEILPSMTMSHNECLTSRAWALSADPEILTGYAIT